MNIINIKDKNLFYIGGVVRDEILGRKSLDVDITYVGDAIEYCRKMDSVEIIQENPDFGTVRVKVDCYPEVLAELFEYPASYDSQARQRCKQGSHNDEILRVAQNDNIMVDIASTRSESYPHKGHLPVVDKIGCSLKTDVMRRDFTINALAKNTLTGEIVDYTGGLEDLKNKKIRVLHDESFIDDPTRIIRALKFSVRFGFELEEHTRKLQEEYLNNINYDMSYKRVKKELIETFNPHCHFEALAEESYDCKILRFAQDDINYQLAFEKFINEGIYKLVTEREVKLPNVNVENLINDYSTSQSLNHSTMWLVYVGVLKDLSRLPLSRAEQKILDDVPTHKLETDFELYKAFENACIETVLLYAVLYDEKGARRYLDDLRNIKISVTGKDLQKLGIKPSPKYQEIFDEILKAKLKTPQMSHAEEIELIKNLFL